MKDYPSFRDFYEKELINSDHREFINLIPADKMREIASLLNYYNIPENYHFFYFVFYQIISLPNISESNGRNNDIAITFSFFDSIKNQTISEITILTRGKNKDGEYQENKIILQQSNPFLKQIETLLKVFGNERDNILKTNLILSNKHRRGPKTKSTTNMLKWLVPEANQLLLEFGIDKTKSRSDFLGKLLVLAGILESDPPFSYKDMSSYFHYRVKQYL